MWSFNRRSLLVSLLALGACGFTPAYGPNGGAARLLASVRLADPDDRNGYLLNQRLEERLGRAQVERFALSAVPVVNEFSMGTTSDGRTTRFQLRGSAKYKLVDSASAEILAEGTVESFTGYSATGTTVATLAAERDAKRRLMVILADLLIEQLMFVVADLPS